MFNKEDLSNMMKQAQQMQDDVKKVEEQLATIEVEGQAGAGMVKITLTCTHIIKRVTIDPSAYEDKKMLEDLIVAAVNDGLRKAAATSAERMAKATANLPLPPGMKLPF